MTVSEGNLNIGGSFSFIGKNPQPFSVSHEGWDKCNYFNESCILIKLVQIFSKMDDGMLRNMHITNRR